jgi:hypothetical protein
VSLHPDDVAFLNLLVFMVSPTHRYCDRCEHQAPTLVVGCIETGSGAGYDVHHCRGCVGVYLTRARALAAKRGKGYQPALPRCG